MKRFSIILLTIHLILNVSSARGQFADNGFIKQDSMNMAILVVDYLSYTFERGQVSYHALCDSCDVDSLPFNVDFMTPMDYGEILYKYAMNDDTLFFASIWWMGQGEIMVPETFLPAEDFAIQDESILLPEQTQYFDYWLTHFGMSMGQYMEKADSAWLSVDSLEIVKEFSEYSYRLGLYAYTPSVGMFDPSVAKWIIFLYYGNDFPTAIKESKSTIHHSKAYPNPFSTATTIEYELDKISSIQFTVYSIQGVVVFETQKHLMQAGRHRVSWSPGPNIPAGLYYAVLRSEEGVSIIKMIKQ